MFLALLNKLYLTFVVHVKNALTIIVIEKPFKYLKRCSLKRNSGLCISPEVSELLTWTEASQLCNSWNKLYYCNLLLLQVLSKIFRLHYLSNRYLQYNKRNRYSFERKLWHVRQSLGRRKINMG